MLSVNNPVGAILSFVCLTVGASGLHAQATGTLLGTVKDGSGAVVVKARITVENESTGTGRATETNGEGTFILPKLSVGSYRLRA
ncbi:MAG: carboxypeptidase-like regulatory domain-containing protein, partial [Bryobacteraceae bacterium]